MATMVNNIASTARTTANAAVGRASETLDYRFPPQKRQEVQDHAQAYAEQNPKSAAFLSLLLLLTVPPILLFIAFVSATLVVSFTVCISVALMVALSFTGLCLGGALLLLLPSLAIGAIVAVSIWLWTLVAIWVGGKFGVFSPELTNATLGTETAPKAPGETRGSISTNLRSNLNSVLGIVDLVVGRTPLDVESPDLQEQNLTEKRPDVSPPVNHAEIEQNPNVTFLREQAQKARNKYGPKQTEIRSGTDAVADQEVSAPIGIQNDIRPLVEQSSAS